MGAIAVTQGVRIVRTLIITNFAENIIKGYSEEKMINTYEDIIKRKEMNCEICLRLERCECLYEACEDYVILKALRAVRLDDHIGKPCYQIVMTYRDSYMGVKLHRVETEKQFRRAIENSKSYELSVVEKAFTKTDKLWLGRFVFFTEDDALEAIEKGRAKYGK